MGKREREREAHRRSHFWGWNVKGTISTLTECLKFLQRVIRYHLKHEWMSALSIKGELKEKDISCGSLLMLIISLIGDNRFFTRL